MIGVYVLSHRKTAVYVGATKRWPLRLTEHKEIQFDQARLFECAIENLEEYERRIISFLRPKHNHAWSKALGKKMTKHWILENSPLIEKSMKTNNFSEICAKARKHFGYSEKYSKHDLRWTIIRGYESAHPLRA